MNNLQEALLECYVFVDDYLRANPCLAGWRRSNNDDPAFTDAEVITMALMQGYFRIDTMKHTYQLVKANAPTAFPDAPGYKQWVRRVGQIPALIGHLVRAAALRVLADSYARLYVVDALPVPVCHPLRHGRVRLLAEDGARFGKTSKGWLFGFKLHALIHQVTGVVITVLLSPGNWDDRRAVGALALSTGGGDLLADKGYSGQKTYDWLRDNAQMHRLLSSEEAGFTSMSQLRQRIESSFSSLWRRFVDRVYARSWRGLWSSLLLKILHFNMERAGIVTMDDSTRD